jgi:hypothetical protein
MFEATFPLLFPCVRRILLLYMFFALKAMHTTTAFASLGWILVIHFLFWRRYLLISAIKAWLKIWSANSSIDPNTGIILLEVLSIERSVELFTF